MRVVDWKAFAYLNSGRESEAFEQLCYLLFCRRYGISGGIVRFFNNPGIETGVIEAEGEVVGWQA